MDGVRQISMVENIRKRVGMYWPTHDGIPNASVWIFFLDQLANEMGATFMRGETPRCSPGNSAFQMKLTRFGQMRL